ncbi:MAG TPA: hypothetical protein VIU14_01565 [Mesorhizobium sp.]|jgi:hypothetical protein
MNSFFFSQGEDFAVPPRVYARLIEIEPAEYVLFDAVNAIFFDNLLEATDGFTPPARPGTTNARAALSYVWNNTHKHPSTASLSALSGVNWSIGTQAACLDERRTENRKDSAGVSSLGGAGLGHIKLDWPSSTSTSPSCRCGCTLTPTQ